MRKRKNNHNVPNLPKDQPTLTDLFKRCKTEANKKSNDESTLPDSNPLNQTNQQKPATPEKLLLDRFGKIFYWAKRYKNNKGDLIAAIFVYFAFSDSPIPEFVKERERSVFNKFKNEQDPKVYNTLINALKKCRGNANSQEIPDEQISVLDFRSSAQAEQKPLHAWIMGHGAEHVDFFNQIAEEHSEENFIFYLLELINENKRNLATRLDHEGKNLAHYAAQKGFIGALELLNETEPTLIDQACTLYNETPLHLVAWALSQLTSHDFDKLDNLKKTLIFLLDKNVKTTIRSTHQGRFSGKDGGTPLHYLCSQPQPAVIDVVRELSFLFKKAAVGGVYLHFSKTADQSSYAVDELVLNPNKFSANCIDRESLALQAAFRNFFRPDVRILPELHIRHRLSVSSMLDDIESDSSWKSLCAAAINHRSIGSNQENLLQIMKWIKYQIFQKINGPQNIFIGSAAANQALGRLIKWLNDPKRAQEKHPWRYAINSEDFDAFQSMQRFRNLPANIFNRTEKTFTIPIQFAHDFRYYYAHYDQSDTGEQEAAAPNHWIDHCLNPKVIT
jgi:hypothetical protein